ncbi:PadR family transcriptional regulator [Prauserella flavalba]|uniref:PadR family transcriptional regulator n=1 Tax=Prauserella flavalba TaxID=1477506 RepID=A0A318LKS7_9PSEU|nr:PadR family transcriptional regulator [Prauserella flavalba]PXY33766.1 PadR family transcriptional regulator [Prauserella flavalba]
MSLRHGLLGLLAGEPGSGYDLTRRFEDTLGSIWPAKHPQIYGELTRLASEGLIEAEAEGPRRRKEYRITDAGLTELRRWLTDVDVDHTMRLDPVLRSLFFWLMSPAELEQHLTEEAEFYREKAQLYRGYAEAKDRGDFGDNPQTRSLRVTVEAAIRLYDSLADWAEWAKTVPPATPK